MFPVFFIYSVLCSHGVRIFGTNLHRFEKFGVCRQRHLTHRLWKRGTYQKSSLGTAVASMRRTEALASVKFYQILSIFIFFIRLIILEDFIRLISYNGPCVRLGCSFFLATALLGRKLRAICGLHLIAKWSCFIYVIWICSVECPYSISVFFS